MTKDTQKLVNIYKSTILNEVSRQYVDEVKEAVKDKELPFNNIFGDKLRILIPINGTEVYNRIKKALQTIPGYVEFDVSKKEVVRKVKTKIGDKEQRISLGRAITALKVPEEEKKEYLDWFARYHTNIEDMERAGKYSIILSRNPVDILRMSDIGSISSCHSEDGAYFHCAVQEAKTGGPVAYIVNTNELNQYIQTHKDKDALQFDEIFTDAERGIKGITALSRIRVRRYKYPKTGKEIGIPEIKKYGKDVSGFYNTVASFLREKQSGLDVEKLSKDFSSKKFIRTGGSYPDSSDSSLFNRMFDTTTFYGSLDIEETDEQQSRWDQFDEELNGFQTRYARDLKHCNVSYDVDGDYGNDDVYYTAYGSMKIELGDVEIYDDFFDANLDEPEYFQELVRYSPNHQNSYYNRIPHGLAGKSDSYRYRMINFLKDFNEYCGHVIDVEYDISNIGNVSTENSLWLGFSFGEDSSNFSTDTDDYKHFCRNVSEWDGQYDKIKNALLKALARNGFIANIEKTKYNTIEEPEDFVDSLENLSLEDEDSFMNFEVGFNLVKIGPDLNNILSYSALESYFGQFVENYLNSYFHPKQINQGEQQSFKNFYESYKSEDLNKYGFDVVLTPKLEADGDERILTARVNYIFATTMDDMTEPQQQTIKFLDENNEHFKNGLRWIIAKIIEMRTAEKWKGPGLKLDNYENLRKVYDHLVNI